LPDFVVTKIKELSLPEQSRQGATAHLVRRLNRSAVLDLIRTGKPIARAEIARKLKMSLPTVMRIVDSLIIEDLVHLSGTIEPSGGRPRPLLEFNANGYGVVGVDLGGTKMYGALANLRGEILHEARFPCQDNSAQENLACLVSLIEQLLAQPLPAGMRSRGIGIGVPGVTYSDTGVVSWAPSLGWRDLPLKKLLSERFAMPVLVENDVNLAALGEYGFGAGKAVSSLVCISVGTGIGAGIVIDRAIYRGHNQSAGEVGYLPPGIEFLGRSYERFGALESLASGSGIVERARRRLQKQGIPQPGGELSAEDVFNAARSGERWACQIVEETVDYLSMAIASVSVLLDPEVIVLGGGVARSADILIEPIQQRLVGLVPSLPRILQSPLGYRAAVMGAIMLVLDVTTEHVAVNHLT
jgi:glucokinase-like ROK family protein